MDPTSHEPEVFFITLFDERMWITIAEQTNNYARSKIRTAHQGMDASYAMIHFSHKQNTHNAWGDEKFSGLI